jgi:hypothetical protein
MYQGVLLNGVFSDSHGSVKYHMLVGSQRVLIRNSTQSLELIPEASTPQKAKLEVCSKGFLHHGKKTFGVSLSRWTAITPS